MTQDKSTLGALPIDIHYNKLLDWLINRRHCTQQYQAYLTVIKDKLEPAKQSTESEEHTDAHIRELVGLESLNFFEIKELFELLKTTDAGRKNIIGQFSSQSMKNWAEIVKLYEKDGTYLAETALKIVRNVNYEVSALKKQISKCQQAQKDYSRKESEHNSSATDLRKQYTASCNRIGIEGKKIKTELASLIKDLPKKLGTAVEEAKSLEEAVKYYKSFSAYILKNESLSQENVKMLTYVIQKGNTSTFEWRTGKQPSRLEPTEINIDLSDEQDKTEESGEIDWGATDVPPDTIDFGDFDITVEDGGVLAADDEVSLETPDLDEIDWCVVDSTSLDLQPTTTDEEDVAKGIDALSIMDNPDTRKALVDDLLELRAFLGQRAKEAASGGGDGNMFSSAPSNIHVDADTLKDMLEKLKSLLENMTSTQMQHLMLIKDSPRYVDRLRDSLRQKLILADKMDYNRKEMARARQAALEEESALIPQVEVFKKETMVLKKKLEEEISQKYDNRTVRIIGEVNTM